MYDNTAEKVDEVAERILMLGEVPVHNFSDYLKTSKISETGIVTDGEEALQYVLNTYKYLLSLECKILSAASEISDEAIIALMSGYISEQEKDVWMLVSYFTK
ncbi:MAG: dps [Bacteroidetes bacterium]|nr:dps [Bacteroidota bacterium]